VNIKLQNVEGSGAYIALYGDTDSKTIFFSLMQGSLQGITGTSDFTEYSATVPYFIATVKNLRLALFLDGKTTGTVYFDDVTLTKYE
jgi:hypothetical protein